METIWYSNPADYSTASHEGREVRIYKGIKAHDSLLANSDDLRHAATGAARMPFAFTANAGVVMADRITA